MFLDMPTALGPVSLRWRHSEDGKTLQLAYEPKTGAAWGHVELKL